MPDLIEPRPPFEQLRAIGAARLQERRRLAELIEHELDGAEDKAVIAVLVKLAAALLT